VTGNKTVLTTLQRTEPESSQREEAKREREPSTGRKQPNYDQEMSWVE